MACECMKIMDAKLAEFNSKLQVSIVWGRGTLEARPYIGVEKINPRKVNKRAVIATFCPFCGDAYEVRSGEVSA